MTFDYLKFAQSLDSYTGMDVKDEHNGQNGWIKWSHSDSDSVYNQVVEYTYDDKDSGETLGYRTWYMETSLMKSDNGKPTGMFVSVKIDYERNTGDDHIILITGFDVNGYLQVAQASIQFNGNSKDNLVIAPIRSSDIALSMYNTIHDLQKDVDYGGPTDNAGRKSFAYITQLHIYAITSAVSV
ncbi:hypothetical protein F5984_10320 [Rudanella paleaurantiibacter]|uniref:Uncharacterized protein n=1 Tax=Rudanella paleaurantiibacter TaxID=2614655 RepID=A0A7J5U0X2_9BACT|nr:hypothetical protein [Rudanella paleaurantiibacter]KAB7731191.1 hypothetical protein F5984_10320 [Rudanella paleaurantiibacter]